jgi:Cytochrome P460
MPRTKTTALVAASVAMTVAASFAVLAQTVSYGGDKINFPAAYDKGVLYTTVDRADNKQYREFYASAEAVAAAKKGEPLPVGTVITMVQFKAKLDPQGTPLKDANGRFIKDELNGYAVMEKQKGWGAGIPEEIRNGEWEYRGFKTDKTVNDKANLKGCFECHKPLDKRLDFVFTYDKMAGK